MTDAPIPLVDLAIQHRQIADDVADGFDRVLDTGAFIKGPDVASFEEELAEACGVAHVVGVANGTDAVELALRAVGVGPRDLVVLPANTFIATAEAVVRAGARPVLVDCEPVHQLIDVDQAIATAATTGASAVVPVDLFGQRAALADLVAAGAERGWVVIEDAAQSQGARRDGAGIGVGPAAAATSFYPGKNLGAYGDGGAVLTDSAELARAVRLLGDHGSEVRYRHDTVGFNSRLDTIQAVVLRAKLRRLDGWNDERRAAAARYGELLGDHDRIKLPAAPAVAEAHVWHLYVVQVPDRDAVLATLQAQGIGAGIHYAVPIHLQPAFAQLGQGPGSFPHAEAAAASILSLPIFPGITADQQERVADALRRAVDDRP